MSYKRSVGVQWALTECLHRPGLDKVKENRKCVSLSISFCYLNDNSSNIMKNESIFLSFCMTRVTEVVFNQFHSSEDDTGHYLVYCQSSTRKKSHSSLL